MAWFSGHRSIAAVVVGLLLVALGYLWVTWLAPTFRPPTDTVVTLPDGASIRIPADAVDGKPRVIARRLAPEELPPLPDWAAETSVIYEFSVDRPLKGPVEIRLPLPKEADLALLGHYRDGAWEPTPFRIEGEMAAFQARELSPFGFLVVSYEKLEAWLQRKPLINWILGGRFTGGGSPCTLEEANDVVVQVEGTPHTVTACAQPASMGFPMELPEQNSRWLVIRNERKFYLDVYPRSGNPTWIWSEGGLPFSCCEDGALILPGSKAVWRLE